MTKKIIILCCAIAPLFFQAQNRKIDSLVSILKKNTADTNRVNALVNLVREIAATKADTAGILAKEAKALSEKLNWKKGIALSHQVTGIYFWTKKDFTEAENSYRKALKLWEELNNATGMALTHDNLALNYKSRGDREKSFDHYSKALEIAKKANDKKTMAKVNGGIAIFYADQENYEKAIEYYTASISLAEEVKDYQQQTRMCNNLSIVYRTIGEYGKSIQQSEKAVKAAELAGNDAGVANAYNSMGATYMDQGKRGEALECHLKSLRIQEKLNSVRGMIVSIGNMALIYQNEKQYNKALENYQRALTLSKESENKNFIAPLIGNIGGTYYDMGNYNLALKYYFESMELEKANGNMSAMALQLGNIGNVYFVRADSAGKKGNDTYAKKEYAEALNYYTDALKIKEEIGVKSEVALSMMNIGDLYMRLKKYPDAKIMLEKAIAIAKEIKSPELEFKCERNLSDLADLMGNYKEALTHLRNSILLSDSISDNENTRKMVAAEMNFEFDKKQAREQAEQDKKDILVAQQKQKQNIVLFAVTFGLVLVLVFSLFMFNRFKVTHKQKKIIESQQIETERQKVLIEEKQKDIVDSINYAKRIQNALLASEHLLDEHLKDYFILFMPKDIVAGDFYWATNSPEGFILVTADCTGHGVPGAFMSLLNINKLNETINQKNIFQPNEILNDVRREIISALNPRGSTTESKDGMDAAICKFNFKNGSMQFACANNPVWILRNGELIEHKPDKMPVGKGVVEQKPFTLQTADLQKGDIVYTITDGYADQFGGPKGKKFMYKAMKDMLVSFASLSMKEQKEKLSQVITEWRGHSEQIDDILIIGVRV